MDKNKNSNTQSTNILDTKETEEEELKKQGFDRLDKSDILSVVNLDASELQEICDLRKQLKELANSLFDIINMANSDNLDPDISISDEDRIELKNTVDDTLLWMHIHMRASKLDYQLKIDELNNLSNKIIILDKITPDTNTDTSPKQELEILVHIIKTSLEQKIVYISDEDKIGLLEHIDNILLELADTAIRTDEYYIEKINEINELSNLLFMEKPETETSVSNNLTVQDSEDGISIADIMKMRATN
jgi:hypothetical protein